MALRGTAPIVPVRDVAETTRFYTKVLGFEQVINNQTHGYACFRFADALIAIIKADGDAPLAATRNNISAQIWVESVDTLWAKWKGTLAELPEGRVNGPFDRDYGVRELHITCPDGFLMFFTEA